MSRAAGDDTVGDDAEADTAAGDEPPEARGWLFCALALVVVAVLYVQVLGGPFIWDDRPLILESTAIRTVDIARFFREPLWAGQELVSAAYYRPLVALSFALDYQLHGENSGGYHLTNLLWHLLATGLVFGALRRCRVSVPVAFVLTTAWALLPRLTEGVAWISGRADVMATACTLAALALYRPGASAGRVGLAALAAFLALCCKETGVVAFIGLGLSLWRMERASGSVRITPLLPRALALGAPLAAYLALRATAGAFSAINTEPLSAAERALTVLEAVGRYAFMLLAFWQPRSFLGSVGHPEWGFVALGVVTLATLAWLARRCRPGSPETAVFLGMAGAALALVLHVLPLPLAAVAADRYLYLPLAASLIALGPWFERQVQARRPLLLAPLALAVLGGARTYQRASDYTDEGQFWSAAVTSSPEHPLALAELGSVAYRAGCLPEALELYLRAVRNSDRTPSSIPLENAALLAAVNGQPALAEKLGDQLVRSFPGRADLELRRATIALTALDFAQARAHAERARALGADPRSASAFLELVEQAQHDARRARANPRDLSAALSLALRAQRFPEVAELVGRALETDSDLQGPLRDGLELLVARGDPLVAEPFVKRYLARGPSREGAALATALRERTIAAASLRQRLRALATSGALPADET